MSTRADNELDRLLPNLQNPAVRDLAWSCFSPPLIISQELATRDMPFANCGIVLDEQRQAWLERLDREPTGLLRHIAEVHSNRLGLYFEALWHFFLQEDPRLELLTHNLPVREGGQTIGEFDCIYYCTQRQRHFHLELAVKFYLGQPGGSETKTHSASRQWLGPGTRDRLDIKLDRLLQHQLKLGQHPSAKALLSDLGIEDMGLEMEIKGRLFQQLARPLPPPPAYNPELPMPLWMNCVEASNQHHESLYVLLEKQHWLAPLNSATGLSIKTMRELCQHQLRQLQRPQAIASVDACGNEIQRFFITPEHWQF